jgi:hypothetical protein
MSQTISQALRRVKKIKGELKEALERAQGGVTYKKDDPPAFLFGASFEKATALRNELVDLESKIAVINAVTLVDYDGRQMPLAYVVKVLKELKSQIAWVDELKSFTKAREDTTQEEASYDFETDKRVTKKVEYKCELPEAKRVELVDRLRARFDTLNNLVENTNHRTAIG